MSPQPRFGANLTCKPEPGAFPTPQQNAAALTAIKPGAIARITVLWRVAQPVGNRAPDFSLYDTWLKPALQAGLRPLIVLMAAPEWAGGAQQCHPAVKGTLGSYCVMPPGRDSINMGHWKSFVEAATRHFMTGDYTGRTVAIEIWNEANAWGYWGSIAGPDPAHYRDVHFAAHDAVRKVDANIPVLMTSLAHFPPTGDVTYDYYHKDPDWYLAEVYRTPVGGRNMRNAVSGIAAHPYTGGSPDAAGKWTYLEKLNDIRRISSQFGDPGRPIWITEFGYPTRSSGGVSWATEQEQAKWLRCAFRLVANAPDIEAFVVYCLIDPATDPADAEANFGVSRCPTASSPGLASKVAHEALKQLFDTYGDSVPPAARCS